MKNGELQRHNDGVLASRSDANLPPETPLETEIHTRFAPNYAYAQLKHSYSLHICVEVPGFRSADIDDYTADSPDNLRNCRLVKLKPIEDGAKLAVFVRGGPSSIEHSLLARRVYFSKKGDFIVGGMYNDLLPYDYEYDSDTKSDVTVYEGRDEFYKIIRPISYHPSGGISIAAKYHEPIHRALYDIQG